MNRKITGDIAKLRTMRNMVFTLFALILAQFWLGMTINLEVSLPIRHYGILQSLEFFGGYSGFLLAHVVNGFLILGASISFLLQSLRAKFTSLKIGATVTLASVVGAVVNGILFLESGQNFGWSVGMAMSAVSALVAMGTSLYFLGKGMYEAENGASL